MFSCTQHDQVSDKKVTVSAEDAEGLKVTMADFQYALEFDVKPAFGIQQSDNFNGEQLESRVSCDS